jgi:hypothetical protein
MEDVTMRTVYAVLVLCAVLSACSNDGEQAANEAGESVELGPYGPPLGVLAPVVRNVTVETSGAITGTFTGTKGQDKTGLRGLCNPAMWANFMLSLPGGKDFDEVWVTNMSKSAVGTGATGDFRLEYVEVTFRKTAEDYSFIEREFRGPGKMTLTTHEAKPGQRRMIGTMEGTGLKGKDDDAGKTLDLKVSFDMDSSCGVKE